MPGVARSDPRAVFAQQRAFDCGGSTAYCPQGHRRGTCAGRRPAPGGVGVKRRQPVATILIALVAAACGSEAGTPTSTGQAIPTSPATAQGSPPASPLVGRWEQLHHCQDLVEALEKAGLRATAPAVVGGQFFGEKVPHGADPCTGAKNIAHSHFFTQDGAFGSLDQDLNQVDEGTYTIVDDQTVLISSPPYFTDARFTYRIENDDTLVLDPAITQTQRDEATADPKGFTEAVWMVTVAYPGTTWKRVPCEGWC
jgi:hypothetical protein